jgi:hypothetical protein
MAPHDHLHINHVSEAAAAASAQIIRSGAALPDWSVAVGAHPEGSTGEQGRAGCADGRAAWEHGESGCVDSGPGRGSL